MTTDQDKQQAIEDYFRALGWEYSETQKCWFLPEWTAKAGYPELPDIIDHFPSFKKWVLEKMEGEKRYGYRLFLNPVTWEIGWCIKGEKSGWCGTLEPIIDNEITLAAVKAATRYWREKE